MSIKSKKILLGFAEALAAPEVCFSLYDAGCEIFAYTRNRRRCSLRYLPFIDLHEVSSPEQDTQACIEDIAMLAEKLDVDAVMPLDDASLWLCSQLKNQGRIAVKRCAVLAEDGAVKVALDKGRQVAAALTAGLSVPETKLVHSVDDAREWNIFPCIAKPSDAIALVEDKASGSTRLGKGQADTFSSKVELLQWLGEQDLKDGFLIQPLVRGVGEGVFGHFEGGKVRGWSAHQRTRMMNPHGSGSSACHTILIESTLKPKIEQFLTAINWSGYFMIELLRDENNVSWFMELNGRAWGSMALARRSGLDYPLMMVESHFDCLEASDNEIGPEPCRVRHIGRELIHLMFVIKGPGSDFYKQNWPGRLSSLMRVLRPGRLSGFYNYHPDFPGFFLKDGWQTVRNFLSK